MKYYQNLWVIWRFTKEFYMGKILIRICAVQFTKKIMGNLDIYKGILYKLQ